MTNFNLSDKELLLKMQELTKEVLLTAEVLQYRYFDDLHRRAVDRGASDADAEIIVAKTFERIVERILTYDPDRGTSPRGWIQIISDRVRADLLGHTVRSEPIDDEHHDVADRQPVTPEREREIAVRGTNEEWTIKRGYQYLQCTVTTVEGLDGEDRDQLREGSHDHPGRQRRPLREAAERYRSRFRACFGSPDPSSEMAE